MKKFLLILCIGCFSGAEAISQSLFTYGNNEVSKDEFVRAFEKNNNANDNKEQSLKEYLQLYTAFKQKVAAAKEMKLDTMAQLRYDMMNFRSRLEDDYTPGIAEAMTKTGYKKNPAIVEEMLYLYADSAAYSKENKQWPVSNENIFYIANSPVKGNEWLAFAKNYKLNDAQYKGESNSNLYQQFIEKTVLNYYRSHLEEYNASFRYEMMEFKEGNLLFEIMGKKVWNKSASDEAALQQYYETHKEKFLWQQSADVILINAKSHAYANYANENMKKGEDWKMIAAQSENSIQGDSARYELSQLPIKSDWVLKEGAITEIVKNKGDEGASFIKLIKLHPANLQRTYTEARAMVLYEYQQQLENNWTNELLAKYPVKINTAVFQSLLR